MKNAKEIFDLRFFVRLGCIVAIILLAVFLYNFGKQRTLLVDNWTTEINGTSYRAEDWAKVSVDGQKAQEYSPRMRISFPLRGRAHTIAITYDDKSFIVDYTGQVNDSEVTLQMSRQNDLLIETIGKLESLSAQAPIVETSKDVEAVEFDRSYRVVAGDSVVRVKNGEVVNISTEGVHVESGSDKVNITPSKVFVSSGTDTVKVSPAGVHITSGDDKVSIGVGGIKVNKQ